MLKPLDKDELKMRVGIGSRVLQTQNTFEKRSATNYDGELDYKMLFEESADAFLLYKDGRYVDCNQSAIDMLGCNNKEELIATKPANFSAKIQPCGQASSEKSSEITALAMERGSHRFEWDHKRTNGEVFPVEVLLTAVPMGAEKGLHITWKDISHSKDQQEKLKLLAHYDVLTQLPNRTLFSDRFKQAVAYSKRTKTLLAVCFVDLDDFKPINDNHGHEIGDQILIEVAERIQLSVREGDTVSRQGGDEFALLLGGLEHHSQAKQILERMLSSLSAPYFINGSSHYMTASCGASMNLSYETELKVLVHQADQAMYQAKQRGKNTFSFYDHDTDWV
jgi:diguanylate cyclase (GGDEF)-like protein/PAS domain S-box-containing protein